MEQRTSRSRLLILPFYALRVAKTLAGVVAVSIAALLFAGCGGGGGDSAIPIEPSTSTTAAKTETTTPTTIVIDYGAQFLAIYGPLKSATDTFTSTMRSSPGIRDSDAMVLATTYSTAMAVFSETLLRSSWPESLQPVVDQVGQNYMEQSKHFRVADGSEVWYAKFEALTIEGRGYMSTIRSSLGLPQ